MQAVTFELIQQRAYEIWQLAGSPHGNDKEHWEQAERELLDAAPTSAEIKLETAASNEAANPSPGLEPLDPSARPRAKRPQVGDEFR